MTLAALVGKVLRRDDLTEDEAAQAMDVVMRGEAHPAQLAGLLIGLAMKGERPAELVGLARTMRAHGVTLDAGDAAVDTCGTGGDRAGTFNISTAAALVVAGAGVPVVKHGNRSVSSRCGSADVLEALGVTVTASPAVVQRAIREAGIAFCFAPTFHPAMRHAGEARKALGVPTAFNLLGPLTNPGRVRYQVVGVARPELTELMARALQQLGARRAWVVHGADGLDELSTTGYSKVSECHGDVVRTFYVHPTEVGLPKAAPAALQGGDAGDNAGRIAAVLAGDDGPARDVVLLNAGAALFVAGLVPSLRDGIARAAASIDDGAAARALHRLRAVTGSTT
jgi:anthranilate phosphoribosyltransferase